MEGFAKAVIGLGVIIIIIGILILFKDQIPFIKKFGHLPGDIRIETENTKVYFPITTSILISLILSFMLILYNKIK